MDDLDEIEISSKHVNALRSSRSSSGRAELPTMGQFATSPVAGEGDQHAIIDGSGSLTPSPFPRSRTLRAKWRKTSLHQSNTSLDLSTDAEAHTFHISAGSRSLVSINAPSSDELGSRTFAQGSEEPPSTDAIDLDDVLDASMLDSEPESSVFEPLDSSQNSWDLSRTPINGTHMRNLTRWDRIPVATFRRTRQVSMLESTPMPDSNPSNKFANIGALNNDMLGTPKPDGKSKYTSSLKKHAKGKSKANLLVVSPVLMPVRDGDRTPTNSGPSSYNPFQQHDPFHQQGSRRDQHKQKAMLKNKILGKYADSPNRQKRYHRHHYPNTKTRATSSMQRTQFFASHSNVPHLSL